MKTRKLEAHEQIKPKKPTIRELVLQTIQDGNRTSERISNQISLLHGFKEFSVRGRITELENDGLIKDENGLYRLTTQDERNDLIKLRLYERYHDWIKQGEKFLDLMPLEVRLFFDNNKIPNKRFKERKELLS